MIGKPTRISFEFAQTRLLEQAEKQGQQITNFYMVGDNPRSDIQGANSLKNWTSILLMKSWT